MKLQHIPLTVCTTLAMLSACGGGVTVTTSNLYAGLWVNNVCESDGTGGSSTFILRLTQVNDASVSGELTIRSYTGTQCAGVPVTTTLSLLQDGTTPVYPDTPIRVVIGAGVSPRNDILMVKDGRLFGGNASSIGADGFPEALDFSRPFNHF